MALSGGPGYLPVDGGISGGGHNQNNSVKMPRRKNLHPVSDSSLE